MWYNKSVVSSLLLAGFVSTTVAGTANAAGGEKAERHEAPKTAIAACSGKKVGESCSFEGRKKQVSGSCQTIEAKKTACMPNKPADKKNNEKRPPKEVVEASKKACENKAKNAECSFQGGNKKIIGTCKDNRQGIMKCKPKK